MSHRPYPLCGNDECPCAGPGKPCEHFEGYADHVEYPWCACCGWEREDHPGHLNAPKRRTTPQGETR